MPRNTPYAGVASLFRAALEQGRPAEVFEDGRQRRNFVHVDDVARAVVAAVTAELPAGLTPVNIGSPTDHARSGRWPRLITAHWMVRIR